MIPAGVSREDDWGNLYPRSESCRHLEQWEGVFECFLIIRVVSLYRPWGISTVSHLSPCQVLCFQSNSSLRFVVHPALKLPLNACCTALTHSEGRAAQSQTLRCTSPKAKLNRMQTQAHIAKHKSHDVDARHAQLSFPFHELQRTPKASRYPNGHTS